VPGLPGGCHGLEARHHLQRRAPRPLRRIGLRERHVEPDQQAVAGHVEDRAVVLVRGLGEHGEVFVEHPHHRAHLVLLRESREAPQVGEQRDQAGALGAALERVTVLACVSTQFLLMLRSPIVEQHDLSSLRVLGSVGEPINPEAWLWYHTHIGRGQAPIVDTWWQTETGMILITPLPGITTTKPGSATFAFPAIHADVVDGDGRSVPLGGGGFLVLKRPWPAMLRGIYGDPERYRETYWSRFPGMYFAGDGAKRDQDGYLWLLGRVDDVMNVAGHRISTIEVESALVDHRSVAEAAVVGKTDEISGQAIFAYVILRAGQEPSDALALQLREHVAYVIGPIARPKYLMFVPDLPKTRSGKIMRRLLRDLAEGRTLGDTTTLADAGVVDTIRERSGAAEEE